MLKKYMLVYTRPVEGMTMFIQNAKQNELAQVVSEIRNPNQLKDFRVYSHFFKFLSRQSNFENVLDSNDLIHFYRSMISASYVPDMNVINSILQIMSDHYSSENVYFIIEEMNKYKLTANIEFYNIFLKRAESRLEIGRILSKMEIKPNSATFSILIKKIPVDTALRLYRSFKSNFDTVLYNELLTKLFKANKFEKAMSVFNEMMTDGVKLNKQTESILIQACLRGDKEKLLWDLVTKYNFKYSGPTMTNTVIECLKDAVTLRDIDQIYDTIEKEKPLNKFVTMTFLRKYFGYKKFQKMIEIYDRCKDKDDRVYSFMIDILPNDFATKIGEICQEARANGVDLVKTPALVKYLTNFRKLGDLAHVWNVFDSVPLEIKQKNSLGLLRIISKCAVAEDEIKKVEDLYRLGPMDEDSSRVMQGFLNRRRIDATVNI
jgi:pentatricopeptide repeat protein